LSGLKRVALIAAVAASALAFAEPGLAAFTPKLTVEHAGGGVRVDARIAAADDPAAQVRVVVPGRYALAAPAAGTDIGDANASAQAPDGAAASFTGNVLAAAPVPSACTGSTPVLATWLLRLTGAGQTIDVPVFAVATAGAEQALGQAVLVVCLAPPGIKFLSLTFTTSGLTPPTAAGEYRWRSTWTPYAAGSANPAGAVEVQSLVRTPTALRLTVKRTKLAKTVRTNGKRARQVWTRATVTGTVTENAAGIAGASVTLSSNGRRLAVVRANARGAFAVTVLFRKGTLTFGAAATVPDRDLGGAACVKSGAAPCNGATVGGTALEATAVRAVAFAR
jgi:hypothetical protein